MWSIFKLQITRAGNSGSERSWWPAVLSCWNFIAVVKQFCAISIQFRWYASSVISQAMWQLQRKRVQIRVHNNLPTRQSNRKHNPYPNPTTKQHAILSVQLNIVTRPTYPEKFIWDVVISPFVPTSVVIVTLPVLYNRRNVLLSGLRIFCHHGS